MDVVMTKSGDWWWLSNREAVCVWLAAAGWDDGKMCVGPDSETRVNVKIRPEP